MVPVPVIVEATASLRFAATDFHRQKLFKNRQQYLSRSATRGACNYELYRWQLDATTEATVLCDTVEDRGSITADVTQRARRRGCEIPIVDSKLDS